ncbi:hypothetical protein SODG_006905 [Sodalis praecaptivus]
MVKISQTYSRGTTFTHYPSLSPSASSDIFHMQIDGGDYNLFSANNQTYVISGDTGEISSDGHRVFAMIDIRSGIGVLMKFICVQISTIPGCAIVPWHPSSALAEMTIMPLHTKKNKNRLRWIFDFSLLEKALSYYPNHQAMIVGDDAAGDKVYEIFEIDNAYYLLNPHSDQIRAMQAGDMLSPIETSPQKGFFKLRVNRKGRLLVHKDRRLGHHPKRKLAPYSLDTQDCLTSKIMFHNNENLIIGKIYQACFVLHLDYVKNQFRIKHASRYLPAIKVGWSEINSMFIPIKPNNGENGGCKIICVNGILRKTFKGQQSAYQQRTY